MFSKSRKTVVQHSSPSIIAGDCALTGDIVSHGEVHIDGQVDGDVRCEILVIGEQGSVIGEINAQTVRVLGAVTGHISAKAVELAKTARIIGDITHESLAVEAGAHVEGRFNRLSSLPAPINNPASDADIADDVGSTTGNVVLLGNSP